MKKRTVILLSMLLVSVAFAAICGACLPKSLQDGTYTAKMAFPDEHGWTEMLTLTVKNGKIIEADCDAINADGKRKSEDAEYNKNMESYGGTTTPSKFYPELEQGLVNTQKVDAVAGATTSSDSMKALYNALVPSMEKGDTTEISVQLKSFKDGTYTAKMASPDEHGWTEMLTLTVKDGKITEADCDAINADGKRKSEDEEYNKNMESYGGTTTPSKFYPELEQSLVNIQKVDAVAGATTSSDSMKALYNALVPNMEKGDTSEVSVTP